MEPLREDMAEQIRRLTAEFNRTGTIVTDADIDESEEIMGRRRKKEKPETPTGKGLTMPLDAIKILLDSFRTKTFSMATLTAAFTVITWFMGLLGPASQPVTPVPVPGGAPGGADAPVLSLTADIDDEYAYQQFENVIAAPDNALLGLPAQLLLKWLIGKLPEIIDALLKGKLG